MADHDKILTKDADGNVTQQQLPGDVTKQTVDVAIKAVLPILKEHGESIGQQIRDSIEQSLEGVAKAIEASRVANEDNAPVNRSKVFENAVAAAAGGDPVQQRMLKNLASEYFKALGASRGDVQQAAKLTNDPMTKTILAESNTAQAGVLVPDQILPIMKELKDNAVVARQFATTTVSINGSATLPKELGLATAYYQDENEDLTISAPSWGNERMGLHKLTGLSVVTNELMKDGINVGELVLAMLTRAYANKENLEILRGTGGSARPLGIVEQVASSNKFNFSGTGTVAEIHAALIGAMVKPREANHGELSGDAAGWMFNSTVWGWMMSKLTTDYAAAPFMAELRTGRLMGSPIFTTNAFPNTLSTNKSDILYGDRSAVMILEGDEMTVDTSRDASIKDANGTLISAFSRDLSVFRIIGRNNVHLLYPDAFSLIQVVPASV